MIGSYLKAANSTPAPASDRHSRLMKRTQSARIKAPSKGIGEGVATLLQVYRSLAFVHEDLSGRAPANSAVVTTAACFAMTMSSSIAWASASGSAQQSRTTTNR
jgi:hypothetical protein